VVPGAREGTLQGMSLSDWLQAQLFERRVVLVLGWLDADLAGKATAALLALDARESRPIELHLDSPGGALEAAFALAIRPAWCAPSCVSCVGARSAARPSR
jgi:ATP-dependent protease ClpP protease subunit